MDYSEGMHTVEELEEMVQIRKEMETLQLRYNEILNRSLDDAGSAIAPPAIETAAPVASAAPEMAQRPATREAPTPVAPIELPEPTPEPAPEPTPTPVAPIELAEPTPAPTPIPAPAPTVTLEPPPTPMAPPVQASKAPPPPLPVLPSVKRSVSPPPTVVVPASKRAARTAPGPTVTPAPKAAPAASGANGGSLRESILAVLRASGTPLSFDEIYAGLEAGEYTLPPEKPKLVVRRILFNKTAFKMVSKDKLGQGKYEVAAE